MVNLLGAIGGGALGGAAVNIVINGIDKFSKTFTKANVGLMKLGAGITAVGIAGAFAVGGLLKLSGQLEQNRIAFTTMLGSAEEADKLLRDLSEFASKTPFTIPGIRQNAKMLLAMGTELDEMLPTLKFLGDVSSGLSVPLERLALNFGQVRVQGRLTGRELRDFSVAGVPLIAELAKNLNLAESEIKDMVSAGDIGFDLVEEAFISMTSEGGKFFNLMDEQSKSLFGQISNITDSLIQLGETMGNEFLPIVKRVTTQIQLLVGWFEQHPTIAKWTGIILLAGTALALIVGPALILVGLLPAIAAGAAFLGIGLLPLTAIIVGVGLAIAGIIAITIKLMTHWDEFRVGTALAWNGIVNIVEKSINRVIKIINRLVGSSLFVKGAKLLGLGDFFEIKEINLGRIDIEAMIEKIRLEKKRKEELEKQTEELVKQSNELSEQEQLVKQLSKFRVVPSTGDIFNPKAFSRSEFKSDFAYNQARLSLGTVNPAMIINIENINGLDPDEIAAALNDKLQNMIDN